MADRDASDLSPQELIVRYQADVWRYLRVMGCDTSTADDLTQETFLTILRRPPFQQLGDASTASYLRTIARNLFISMHRRNRRVRLVAEVELLDQVWDRWMGAPATSSDELLASLRLCLDGLTERAQLVLRLRFADGKSRVEIGEQLGISEHGAKNLMQRAKQQLKECVQTNQA